MSNKSISLVIAARNDNYMGNSNWRLETTLNYIASQLEIIHRLSDTEIIIVDWGSSSPLRKTIHVNASAEQIIRYIEVPLDIHGAVCQGSDFPISIAFNVGIRRARGEYIALTSGDVLWTGDILQSFFLPDKADIKFKEVLEQSLIFIPRKNIPWEFVNQNPGMDEITKYIARDGGSLDVEPLMPFYLGCAGALVMHRNLWAECRGNDERLVFWGYNDIDLCLRMRLKYSCIDYDECANKSVYHLEHYPSRRCNDKMPRKSNPHIFNPFVVNEASWGLAQYTFAEFPQPRDGNILLLPAYNSEQEHLYRLRHLKNILFFMSTKFSVKHFRWSYSILKDLFIDTFTWHRNS
jgi:glycosyltransferase involved in cell wall biosynthesis